MLCFRTLCVLGGGICRPRVNGLARVDERGACFVVVPIKYSVGVRHALIAPQSYDVRVHVYTYSKRSLSVWPHAHQHIFISVTSRFFTWELVIGTVSIPYSTAG